MTFTVVVELADLDSDYHQDSVAAELVALLQADPGRWGLAAAPEPLVIGRQSSFKCLVGAGTGDQAAQIVVRAVGQAIVEVHGNHAIGRDGWDPLNEWKGLSKEQFSFSDPTALQEADATRDT